MAGNRFYGPVGYGVSREEPAGSGVWTKCIAERSFYGDVKRSTRRLDDSDKVNNDISVGNSIEIVADESTHGDLFDILYVLWRGVYWVVDEVQVLPDQPRLLLRLGGVYDGDKAPAPGTSQGTAEG